jgi:hypothetical protein
MRKENTLLGVMTVLAVAATAPAAQVNVGNANPGVQAADRIEVSTTWTANNTYNLLDQIYVVNGATLTIEPGTLIASTPTANGSGSLAVTRGCQIFVQGTEADPVIMTSTADVATWTGGNPQTGTWRPEANEWGNLTILGEAFISKSVPASLGNSATCNANNLAPMEGLVPPAGETYHLYGGNQDNDDSGTITYLSLRYGGRVVGLANELNGLSLGGVGRNTDIHHIDIMNNVDDGVEIWGGTVNLKYVNVWNVGDDSFDVDQGWRGKAQFGLIVQGYSTDAAQGSGIGDNCFETDGAENSDAQPVTTAAVYNFTVIGQPIAGDDGTAWRDNARVQYRNCIFMDLGENLVQFDNSDGELSQGYGFNGTLSWLNTWSTDYTVTSPVNACNNPNTVYQAQSAGNAGIGQGKLAEITDSVFFRNQNAAAYSNANGADAVGVTVGGASNPAKGNVVAPNLPIAALTRSANEMLQGGTQTLNRVVALDPRAATNAALNSIASAPNDGFYTSASYRGAFSGTENWLTGWTAADAFGFSIAAPGGCAGNIVNSGASANRVDVDDMLAVISAWGNCPAPPAACPANVVNTGTSAGRVDVDDLLFIISNWGPCS